MSDPCGFVCGIPRSEHQTEEHPWEPLPLEELLRAAERLAKHMAGLPRGACADGLLRPGHGVAA